MFRSRVADRDQLGRRSRKRCLGSQEAATFFASNRSSPPMVTPDTFPSSRSILSTAAPHRISTPLATAAFFRASIRAGGPPAIGSATVLSIHKKFAAVPGDHGPAKQPSRADPASPAFKRSLANHSLSQSAMHIGVILRTSIMSLLPSRRRESAALPRPNRSLKPGSKKPGGCRSDIRLNVGLMRWRKARKSRYRRASSSECLPSSSAAASGSR